MNFCLSPSFLDRKRGLCPYACRQKFQWKPVTRPPSKIWPLAAVCLACSQVPVFGFHLTAPLRPSSISHYRQPLVKKLWKPLLIVKERAKKTLFPNDMTGSWCHRFHHTIGSIFQALSFFFYIFLFLFHVFLLKKPWFFTFFPFSILFLRYSNKALQSKFSTRT